MPWRCNGWVRRGRPRSNLGGPPTCRAMLVRGCMQGSPRYRLCYAMLPHVMLCDPSTCHVMLCHAEISLPCKPSRELDEPSNNLWGGHFRSSRSAPLPRRSDSTSF
eukprot:361775-Chlamydomonas_euryale.AAC.15